MLARESASIEQYVQILSHGVIFEEQFSEE